MAERSHLSIGEVLSLLREEFPDVTISKIRFLESQGLVDPERTPSGYRKFYDHDVERLRWILRQQREHFLPLKVIRGRLTEQGEDEEDVAEEGDAPATADLITPEGGSERLAVPAGLKTGAPTLFAGDSSLFAAAADPTGVAASPTAGAESEPAGTDGTVAELSSAVGPGAGPDVKSVDPAIPSTPASGDKARHSVRHTRAKAEDPPPVSTRSAAGNKASKSASGSGAVTPSLFAAARTEPTPSEAASTGRAGSGGSRVGGDPVVEADSYSAEELAAAVGATPALVNELKQFGLINAHAVVAGTPYFEEASLAVVRAAAQFARHGVEVRHLRAWRNAADREAGLFEQIVLPLLRQRNPQSRRHAAATLSELAQLGSELRSALVDQAIREIR